jgi:hypothetical protein
MGNIHKTKYQQGEKLMITIDRIKNIAKDIIADDEWVNDSHTKSEHAGVKAGLEMLIRHLEELQQDKLGTSINIFSTNKVN